MLDCLLLIELQTFPSFVFTLFLILIGNSIYASNQGFGEQENEANVKTDIQIQENECNKDTQCKHEQETNNSINVVTINKQTKKSTQLLTCQECFNSILSKEQINTFLYAFGKATEEGPFISINQVSNFIHAFQGHQLLNEDLTEALITNLNTGKISEDQFQKIITCLQEAGLDVEESITG